MEPDDLYGLPLDRFIPERTALAKALRADKRRYEAAAVAALRKPSLAAWAVNQLVRTQGAATQELYEAGDELRAAQSELLAGKGDASALRAANERERAAVDALVEAARGLLDADGHELSPAIVERVGDTLHAAALDEQAREQVREGRLERELRHVGLGFGETVFAAAPPAERTRQAKTTAKPKQPKESGEERAAREQAIRERAEKAKRAERERADARRSARTAEAAARRRAERSAHALRAAQERRERAARALAEADEAVAAARAEAEEAARAHRDAKAEIERL